MSCIIDQVILTVRGFRWGKPIISIQISYISRIIVVGQKLLTLLPK